MKSVRIAAAACAGLLAMACAAPGFAGALAPQLYLSADGVAFSSFPGKHNVLRRTITVERTTGKTPAAWTASSDQSWLTVTPSGVTGGKLVLQVDPEGLAPDQLYTATVTVTTSDGFKDTKLSKATEWVGSKVTSEKEVQQNALHIATNPVLPYAYAADGSGSIVVYNVYSAETVATFKNVASAVGAMEVSSDGATLFAADTKKSQIVALDAATGALLDTYNVGYQIDGYFNMVYARPYGQPALYLAPNGNGDGGVMAYPSGAMLVAGGFGGGGSFMAATPDGRGVYTIVPFSSPGTIYGYSLSASTKGFAVKPTGLVRINGENCQDIAVSRDGKAVYPACGAPYEFDVYDTKSWKQVQTLAASPYPDNIEVDTFDNVVGGITGVDQADDVFVFNRKGKSLGQVQSGSADESEGQEPGTVKVSGDSTRVISVTDHVFNSSQTLIFRNMP
jgi:sugar lactone lactonase YvrE